MLERLEAKMDDESAARRSELSSLLTDPTQGDLALPRRKDDSPTQDNSTPNSPTR